MITISKTRRFISDDQSGAVGSSSPSGDDGFGPDDGAIAFVVRSLVPYTLWLKDQGGTWSQGIIFNQFNIQNVASFSWGSYAAAYVQAEQGASISLREKVGGLVDSSPEDSTYSTDELIASLGTSLTSTSINIVSNPQESSYGNSDVASYLNGNLDSHIIPSQNAQYDLGSAEYKIRHLFLSDNSMYIGDTWIKAEGDQVKMPNLLVGDINLNNDGRTNEVDGTSGHWSIQEGSDDLFLINRKTGKKYKFNITEVE